MPSRRWEKTQAHRRRNGRQEAIWQRYAAFWTALLANFAEKA
jgi:hypothetical protein